MRCSSPCLSSRSFFKIPMRHVLIRVTLTRRRSRSQFPIVHISELCTSSSAIHVAEDRPILVRDFIRDALYNPQHGFFAARPEAVGMLPEPISFNLMKGRRHYMQHLHELYKQNDISWFTPIELFKPWYGYALAKYILRNHNPKFPLQIFEIGGGTGTCAKNILDYIKIESPSVYDSMRYVSVEISNALANTQLNSIHVEKTHRSHFFVECRDACKRSGWGKVDEHPCFVIMLEVLDNQPHDLIYKENSSCPWLETHITKGLNSVTLNEVHQPVEDPLILRCIKIMECGSKSISPWLLALKNFFNKVIPFQKKAWIPTASLQLLEALYTVRPNMALIISDFSVLPDVKVQGERAPLVARKKDGVTVDLSSYLDVKGDADIFFPTDFHLLRKFDLYCHSTLRSCATNVKGMHGKRKSHIVTMSQFMRQYAEISKTETKNGFNPLLDDYSNMKFYLAGWV